MRYKLRTLLIVLMVVTSGLAASARLLESAWFADLTGWHGGGGLVVETFSREVAWKLISLPCIFAVTDCGVALNMAGQQRLKWFWIVWLPCYVLAALLCISAFDFSNSARE